MAAGIGNPNGFVPVTDGGNPRIVTLKAAENISGGAFVYASGAANAVGSGADSLVTSDVACLTNASGLLFTGVSTQSVASGGLVPVATRGVIIAQAHGDVTAGQTVLCNGTNAITNGTTAGHIIGRALSSATSGGFALFDING